MIIIHASYIMKYIHVSIYHIICKNTTIIIKLNAIAASIARLILRFVNNLFCVCEAHVFDAIIEFSATRQVDVNSRAKRGVCRQKQA